MLNQLKACQGKQIAIELLNGNRIYGKLLEVSGKTLRVDSNEGIATLLVDSVQVIWENQGLSLTEADMKEIVEKLKDEATDIRYVCLGANGFRCPQSYTCRPPHACNNFACPGLFNTAFVPPDEPCVGQFFGFKRQASGLSSEGNKETKE